VLAQLAELPGDGPAGAGKAALLVRGRLRANVAPQPPGSPAVITTPHAEATVLGTRFTLAVEARATRLDVQEGKLRLRKLGGGDPVTVGGAEYALVGEGLDLAPVAKPRGTALLVVGYSSLTSADERVKRRLERLGLEVRVTLAGPPPPDDLRDAAVVVISSTASADTLGIGYRELAVPLVLWEPNLYDELGMTGPERGADLGVATGTGELVIKDPAHALAAGLGGSVAAVALPPPPAGEAGPPRRQPDRWMSYGQPGAHAQVVATWPGRPTRAVIFGYERGAPMVGLPAPARRVGLYLHNRSPNLLTEAGWRLFDAAIVWALDDARR
jgi:hypothetical protein